MASYCTQHRTGSTCEEVSKKWNMLPPSFCLAKQLGDAQFHADLTEAVRDVLRKYLHVTEQAPELDSEGLRLSEFARKLLFSCYVDQQSDNQEHSEAEQTLCEARRKKEAEQFLAFFSPPWCGVIRHLCPVGCCGPLACSDRVKSIDKGTDLIMKIILPRLTVPAANRYTKIFPVVTSICLMLHFFKILKKALGRLLQGVVFHSDDDQILQDADAVVGAPTNAIVHQRKLQEKQRQKMLRLVEDNDSPPMIFLVWVTVVQLIMPLHYKLFKRGVFFNQMQQGPDQERRYGCFELCTPSNNPAAQIISIITVTILEPSAAGSQHLKLLLFESWTTRAQLAAFLGLRFACVSHPSVCPALATVGPLFSAIPMVIGSRV